ncbi:MAG: TolC family protein [Planctomycetota bacterium]
MTRLARSRAWRCFLILLTIVGPSGCIVGPDYAPPNLCAPDEWHQELVDGHHANVDEIREWWWLFDDPVLGELIERAKSKNLNLYAAFTRICQARAQVCVAESGLYPVIGGLGGWEESQQSLNGLGIGGIPGFILGPFGVWSLGWDISWEANIFGRVTRQIEAADATLGISVEAYRDVMVILLGDVAANYVTLRTLQQRLRFVRQNVQTQSEALELATKRVEGGIAPILDEYQARSNLASTQATIPPLELAIHQTLNRLSVLIGEFPGHLHCTLAEPAPIPAEPSSLPLTLPCDVIRQRPDIREAERRIAAATADLGVAVSDLFPTFNFNGSFSLRSQDLSKLLTADSFAFAYGPNFRFPIFQGKRLLCNIEGSKAVVEEALANYEQVVLLAVEEVENSIVGYQKEIQRYELLEETVDAAQDSLDSVLELYRSGKTDFNNVLGTLRTLFLAQDELAVSEGDKILQLVSLYRSLGGGWDPDHHCGHRCVRLACPERCDPNNVERLTASEGDLSNQYGDPNSGDATDANQPGLNNEGLERLPALEEEALEPDDSFFNRAQEAEFELTEPPPP